MLDLANDIFIKYNNLDENSKYD